MSVSIGQTIYYLCSTYAPISAVVGSRIYPNVAPLKNAQTFPYIVYRLIGTEATNTKGTSGANAVSTGPSDQKSILDVLDVQISIFDTSMAKIATLSKNVRNVVDRGVGSGFHVGSSGPIIDSIVFDNTTTLYEDDITPEGVWHVVQTYKIRVINEI